MVNHWNSSFKSKLEAPSFIFDLFSCPTNNHKCEVYNSHFILVRTQYQVPLGSIKNYEVPKVNLIGFLVPTQTSTMHNNYKVNFLLVNASMWTTKTWIKSALWWHANF
jgi:hypothetical protein